MVACICHLIFPATTQYFLKKYCVVATLSQHIIYVLPQAASAAVEIVESRLLLIFLVLFAA